MSDKSLEERIILDAADATDETELEWQRAPCGFEHVIAVDETCAICVYRARIEALERVMDDAFEIDESGYVCASYDGWEPIPGEKQDMYRTAINPGDTE